MRAPSPPHIPISRKSRSSNVSRQPSTPQSGPSSITKHIKTATIRAGSRQPPPAKKARITFDITKFTSQLNNEVIHKGKSSQITTSSESHTNANKSAAPPAIHMSSEQPPLESYDETNVHAERPTTVTNHDTQNIPPPKCIPAFKHGDYKQFMRTVEALAQMPTPTPSKSDFRFDFTEEAAIHNSKLLEAADFDFTKAIQSQTRFTTLSMGSELRPTAQLDSLLSHHPNYQQFHHNTINGIDYPAPDLDEETRIKDLME